MWALVALSSHGAFGRRVNTLIIFAPSILLPFVLDCIVSAMNREQVAYADMTAKIAINRPEVHNAFRPITVNEMRRALDLAQDDRWVPRVQQAVISTSLSNRSHASESNC